MSEEMVVSFRQRVRDLQQRIWLIAGVVLLVALILLAIIVHGQVSLPEHFWNGFGGAVLGAIVGGTLAAGGGYLATRRIRQLDIKRAEDQTLREYRAAIVVVLDELLANRAVARHLTQGPHFVTDPSSVGLSEASYLAVEHSLAERLPPTIRNAVANAYAEIRARDTLFGSLTYQPVGGGGSSRVRTPLPGPLEQLLNAISRAITALEAVRDSWKESR